MDIQHAKETISSSAKFKIGVIIAAYITALSAPFGISSFGYSLARAGVAFLIFSAFAAPAWISIMRKKCVDTGSGMKGTGCAPA